MDIQDTVMIGGECYREATMFELTQPNGEVIQVPGFITPQGQVSLLISSELMDANFEKPFTEDTLQIPIESMDIPQHFLDDNVVGTEEHLEDINIEQFQDPIPPVRKRGRPKLTDAKVYACVPCNVNTLTYEGYKKHLRIHSTQKEHPCGQCSQSFNNEKNLKLHLALHNEDNLQCPECNKSFTRTAAFRAHLTFHEEEDNVMCSECGEEFEFPHQLEQHKVKRHQRNDNEPERTPTYKCFTCRIIFPTAESLADHKKEHKDASLLGIFDYTKRRKAGNYVNGHDCKVCGKRFGRPSQVLRHMRIHTGEKPYTCNICSVAFSQKGSLQVHLSKHSGYRPHKCGYCKAKFIQRGNLKAHIGKVHKTKLEGQLLYQCTECSCSFSKPGTLHCHMTRAHFPPNADSNEYQDTSPVTKEDAEVGDILRLALQESGVPQEESVPKPEPPTKKEKKENKFIISERRADKTVALYSVTVQYEGKTRFYMCHSCSRGFKKPSDLIKHFRIHTREKPYQCNICFASFSLNQTLIGHMRKHQPGLVKAECLVCKKRFSHPQSLKKHELCHNGPARFPCDSCTYVGWSERMLERHQHAAGHGGVPIDSIEELTAKEIETPQPFVRVADGEFKAQISQKTKFLVHSQNDSAEERPHKCQVCQLRFRKSCHLKQHVLSHTGHRPYVCNICQKTFTKYSVLKGHLKTHLGLRPFPCKECRIAFSTKGSLRRHYQTFHTEEKNFMCPFCTKQFKTSMQCKRHMKSHKELKTEVPQELSPGENKQEMVPHHVAKQNVSQELVVVKSTQFHVAQPMEQTLQCVDKQTLQYVDEQQIVVETQAEEGNFVNFTDENGTITLPLSKESFQELEQSLNQPFFDPPTDPSVVAEETMVAPKELLMGVNMEVADYEGVEDMFQILPDAAGNLCGFPVSLTQPREDRLSPDKDPEASGSMDHQEEDQGPDKLHKCEQCGWVTDSDRMLLRHLQGHYALEARPRPKRTKVPVKEFTEEETVALATINPEYCATESEKMLIAAAAEKLGKPKKSSKSRRKMTTRCDSCGREFTRMSDLVRHERTHTGERPYACELCHRRFTLKSTLVYHMSTHTARSTIKCHVCNAVFSARSSLKIHMRLHTGERPFHCIFCSERFRTSGHLKNHLDAHKAKSARVWPNDAITIENYLNLPRLTDDLNDALDEKENVNTPDSPNLNDSLVPLPDESMAQLLNEQLAEDLNQVFAEPDPPPPKKRRGKTSNGPTLHRCATCQRTFTKPSLLIRHERVHTGERPFPCTICSRAFNQRHVLDEHIKAHHGERSFACPYCSFTSVQSGNLRVHIGRLHQFAYYLDKAKEGKSGWLKKIKEEERATEVNEALTVDDSLASDVVYGEVRNSDLEQVMGELFPQVT